MLTEIRHRVRSVRIPSVKYGSASDACVSNIDNTNESCTQPDRQGCVQKCEVIAKVLLRVPVPNDEHQQSYSLRLSLYRLSFYIVTVLSDFILYWPSLLSGWMICGFTRLRHCQRISVILRRRHDVELAI